MYSDDRRWWWDGQAWQPVPPVAAPPPFLGAQSAQGPQINPAAPGMFWFFNTPDWIGPVLLTALIAVIPIVGAMVLYGWLLETRDNIRRGQWVLPPAGFRYLGRGVSVWVALFLHGVYFFFVPIILVAVGLLVAIVTEQPGALIALLVLLVVALYVVAAIGLGFLYAAIFDLADSRGIGIAAAPWNAWRAATADSSNSWRAFGALFVGILIVSLINTVAVGFLFLPGAYLMALPAQVNFNPNRAA